MFSGEAIGSNSARIALACVASQLEFLPQSNYGGPQLGTTHEISLHMLINYTSIRVKSVEQPTDRCSLGRQGYGVLGKYVQYIRSTAKSCRVKDLGQRVCAL